MHHSFQKKSAVFWRVTSIRLLLAILGLIIAQILMIYMIFTKEKQVILVPQLIASKDMGLSNKSFTNEYVTQWADGLIRTILCVNADTVEDRMKAVLRLTSPRYFGSIEEQLKKEVEELNKQRISTVFYPKEIKVYMDKKEIEIKGIFHTYFGKDKTPVVEEKKWRLGWEMGAFGVILLTEFYEMKEEK
ncbi:MAG: TraE/TraK family type IV conjugative transfer system protein [Alphaproteobacteria bacterium]|jgi:type IV conjugative transfer system protein TraE